MDEILPTTERLARALEAANDPALAELIIRARAGHYDDYKTDIALPIVTLVADLERAGHPELAQRAREGEFDATPAEVDAWFNRTVELMGHGQTSGRIVMENGLLRVDVPVGDTFRTEYYGMAAIYSIKIVSQEIARAYAHAARRGVYEYDAPIVTREQHQAALDRLERQNRGLVNQIQELSRRLTSVNALPQAGQAALFDDESEDDEDDEEG